MVVGGVPVDDDAFEEVIENGHELVDVVLRGDGLSPFIRCNFGLDLLEEQLVGLPKQFADTLVRSGMVRDGQVVHAPSP
ncbi:MAG: hypothetical protein Q7J48_04805 [Nocardioides sp.]|nr:hypothetical protein [Nocardioides sp.]